MTDNKTLQSIVANGGWCEINPKQNHTIIDKRLGRILYNGIDHIIIQRFVLSGEYADGFYIAPKAPFLKLVKAAWLNKYLTVGGKVIEEGKVPNMLTGKDWVEFLNNLKKTAEAVKILTNEGYVYGYIKTMSSEALMLQRIEPQNFEIGTTIKINAIQFMEIETKDIRAVSAQYRRQLTRG